MEGVLILNVIKIPAYGKINLTLDVLGKRSDGYHDVEMIMQSIELHDQITLRESDKINIICDHPLVPNDQTNLAYRATQLIQKKFSIKKGLEIEIEKNIPVAAGLAGGSSDAAGVLVGLNQFWNLDLSIQSLMKLGAELGADVPFCIHGGTALATGIGTDIASIQSMPTIELILIKPNLNISTGEIYAKFSAELVKKRPNIKDMIKAITEKNLKLIKNNLINVLQDITMFYYPQLAVLKSQIEGLGLSPVLMSGSGPTLFVLMDSKAKADELAWKISSCIEAKVIRTRTRSQLASIYEEVK